MDVPFLETAPPLDPAWLEYEKEAGLLNPKPKIPPLVRQRTYATECRELTARMTAEGARDHHFKQQVSVTNFCVPSTVDEQPIPVRQYGHWSDQDSTAEPEHVLLYIHGGGLMVGENDSEELQCLRILKESRIPGLRVYSVGYRLMPQHPASICLSDCVDVFNHVLSTTRKANSKGSILLVGSSSGGELAALVSQAAPLGTVAGVVLRGPVTVDSSSGAPKAKEYIPEQFRALHHSATVESFFNSLGAGLYHEEPRDGLPRMPLDIPVEELRVLQLPRTWIQVCTNDFLYSDGVCYAELLADAGVEVRVDVVEGWPHTFWLKAPELPRALEADRAMLSGLRWVSGLEKLDTIRGT